MLESRTNKYHFHVDLNRDGAHSALIKLIPPGSRVLDVGCASGYVARVLKDRGCEVTGIELDPAAAREAAEVCEVMVGNVEELDLPAALGDRRFDVVLLGDVLEHLRRPDLVLRRLAEFLAEDGFFVASLPNVAHGSVRLALLRGEFRYRELGLLDNTHLRFFTRDTVMELFDSAGLEVTELIRIQAGLFDTEIPPPPPGSIPPAVLAMLEQDPDALTYQFVVRAVPKGEVSRSRYLAQQAANLAFEAGTAAAGEPAAATARPGGKGGPSPQTGLASLIIPVLDNLELTRQCVESIFRHTPRPFELIVVDNGSGPETRAYLCELAARRPNVRLVFNPHNEGYAYACNQGIALARGEYLVVLNNDLVLTPGWLGRLIAPLALAGDVAAVGPVTNYCAGDQRVDDARYRPEDLDRWAADWAAANAGDLAETGRLIGFCVAFRRAAIDRVGGFDPVFGTGNLEDDDLCLRLRLAGYRLFIARDVFVHHHGHRTFGALGIDFRRLLELNLDLFAGKWGLVTGYQAYSQADVLSRTRFDPELHYVPPDSKAVFHPGVPPMAIEGRREVALLLIPDWSDPSATWREAVRGFLAGFTAEDPVTLVVRVEPTTADYVSRVCLELEALQAETQVPEPQRPDVVVEATFLPPRRRGALYTAASAFIPLPGQRRRHLVREATACGLPVAGGWGPEDLRRLVRRALECPPAGSGPAGGGGPEAAAAGSPVAAY